MVRLLFFLIISIALVSCNSGGTSDNPQDTPTQNTETPAPSEEQATAPNLPSVPLELLEKLWEECDYIDYVFYYFNFSMSQDKQASIRGTLRQISDEPAVLNPSCKPLGRLFYQIDGENALEADLHLSNECAYFVFYKDGKQTYANKLTTEGLQFYQNIFSQIQKNSQGQ